MPRSKKGSSSNTRKMVREFKLKDALKINSYPEEASLNEVQGNSEIPASISQAKKQKLEVNELRNPYDILSRMQYLLC